MDNTGSSGNDRFSLILGRLALYLELKSKIICSTVIIALALQKTDLLIVLKEFGKFSTAITFFKDHSE